MFRSLHQPANKNPLPNTEFQLKTLLSLFEKRRDQAVSFGVWPLDADA